MKIEFNKLNSRIDEIIEGIIHTEERITNVLNKNH